MMHASISPFDWNRLSWSTLIHMANQHYVMGRIAVMHLSLGSAHLLMQQTLELGLKAFVKRKAPETNTKVYSHRLTNIFSDVYSDHDLLSALASDPEAMAFMEMLEKGYNVVRYAEASYSFGSDPFGVETRKLLGTFDRVACSMLRAMHGLTKVYTCTILHVLPPVYPLFIQDFHEKVHLILLPPDAMSGPPMRHFPVQIILEPRAFEP
jgi:hypothetical protein